MKEDEIKLIIPETWLWINLQIISRIIYRYPTFYGMEHLDKGVPVIRGEHINNDGTISDDWSDYWFISQDLSQQFPKTIVEIDDLVMSVRGSIGKIGLINGSLRNAQISPNCIKISLYKNYCIPKFYLYYLKSFTAQTSIQSVTNSTTINTIKASVLSKTPIPLPPVNEQRRIVAKLEKLLAKVNTCKQRLNKIPAILKRFRQSVLAAACSGHLTADWRENNPDAEPASELLQQIQEKRKNQGKNQEIVAECIEDEEIPETWICVQFGSIIGELKNGISPRPNMEPPGTPVLRISAVRGGKLDLSDVRYLIDAGKFIPNYAVQEKDLIFTRYNGTLDLVGACGMVREVGEKIILYPDKLIRVRFDHDLIEPGYAEIYFQTPVVREKITSKSKSSAGQNGVSGQDIKNQLFTMPPLAEQQEIIRRVETLFKLADQIEQRYQKARGYVDKLTQSILAEAFRGELVPQDPNDEPASVLLERIRAERAKREAEAKAAKKSTGKKGGRRGRKAKQQDSEPIQLELPVLE